MQYRCFTCSRSVDIAHSFTERTPQEHRTGDGSYTPCSGTLFKLPYAMPKLMHNAVDFSLLPPGVELDMTTISADVVYRVRVDELKNHNSSCDRRRRIVEGTWLGAELLTWGGPMDNITEYQVRVFKAGVDPNTPSDGTQPCNDARQRTASARSTACCQRVLAAGSARRRPRLACSA